jgi:hypothetical protein
MIPIAMLANCQTPKESRCENRTNWTLTNSRAAEEKRKKRSFPRDRNEDIYSRAVSRFPLCGVHWKLRSIEVLTLWLTFMIASLFKPHDNRSVNWTHHWTSQRKRTGVETHLERRKRWDNLVEEKQFTEQSSDSRQFIRVKDHSKQ